MDICGIPKQTLKRLPLYLAFLKRLPPSAGENISATAIAAGIGLNQVQVRKDLALVSHGGRPKTGYPVNALMADIERALGYDDMDSAVLVGAGHLGAALLSYKGFARYGLDIVAAFDTDESVVGTTVGGKKILHADKLGELCRRRSVRMGIITVPEEQAQAVCDALVASGVLAIWNFAPVHLNVSSGIIVQNENMAASLAVLSNHLRETICPKKSN